MSEAWTKGKRFTVVHCTFLVGFLFLLLEFSAASVGGFIFGRIAPKRKWLYLLGGPISGLLYVAGITLLYNETGCLVRLLGFLNFVVMGGVAEITSRVKRREIL